MSRGEYKVDARPTSQKVEPKSITVSKTSPIVGKASLIIANGQVRTHGSLMISLEELKKHIKHYEELE